MLSDDEADEIDHDFDATDGGAEVPLYVFHSRSGRVFLSALEPPAGFPLDGDVAEVDDLTILEEDRAIPCVNWVDEDPAVLYWLPGTNDFAIGFDDGEGSPTGYISLGHNFAFVIDQQNLQRAMEADA